MAKLRLDLDTITVDSFDTAAAAGGRGTVQAHNCCCNPCQCTCCGTCCPTAEVSCNGTCVDTCDHSCWGTCFDYSCWETCAGQYTCESITGHQIICMC